MSGGKKAKVVLISVETGKTLCRGLIGKSRERFCLNEARPQGQHLAGTCGKYTHLDKKVTLPSEDAYFAPGAVSQGSRTAFLHPHLLKAHADAVGGSAAALGGGHSTRDWGHTFQVLEGEWRAEFGGADEPKGKGGGEARGTGDVDVENDSLEDSLLVPVQEDDEDSEGFEEDAWRPLRPPHGIVEGEPILVGTHSGKSTKISKVLSTELEEGDEDYYEPIHELRVLISTLFSDLQLIASARFRTLSCGSEPTFRKWSFPSSRGST